METYAALVIDIIGAFVYMYTFCPCLATCYACRRLLTTIGRLGDLGPDQRIYAVRYDGAMAYIVTLRKKDPLCAMLLANPTRMVSLGALKGARV
ncbi:hypothetical protein I4F81_008581 [Pyropia yezoensis]|uniref:Uncharacterized protein n=1 Tax=Pyropia yezoensis TaxID=2788 RepID=A0ACC3C8I9_PYRYE|nr:hypothetical protein I4F81_008581 [Neopyropia yezoensis]